MKKSFRKYFKIFCPSCFLLINGLFNYAQDHSLDPVLKSFDEYRIHNLQEKIFANTDRSFYVAGEIIWFKLYAVDGHFHKPIDLSKLAYVEILSADKKPVFQSKVQLQRGTGHGSFQIPLSVGSGNYFFRAYTRWMKNLPPDFYFEKMLTIVNPARRPAWTARQEEKKADIQFFPEGGTMVSGIQSRLGFRVVERSGKGLDCKGFILDQQNDTAARFNTLKFGMGNFLFTPVQGKWYTVWCDFGSGLLQQKELPTPQEKGLVMNVGEPDREHLLITVRTNDPRENPRVYLFAQTRQLIRMALGKEMVNGSAEFLIDKKLLGEGISQLTIFNAARKPVCERLYFRRPEKDLPIQLQLDKSVYSRREKIYLDIHTLDSIGRALAADLSASVFLLDSLQVPEENSIQSYLWLSADLKGRVESPNYYFEHSGPEVDLAMDNLMLTQGWRRFKWEDVLENKKPTFEFSPEYDGHIIDARITDRRTGKPVPNISTYFSVPGYHFRLAIATSNEDGYLRFDIKNYYGPGEIVLQTNSHADSLLRIDVLSPFPEKYTDWPAPPFEIPEKWSGQLAYRSMHGQVQNSFVGEKRQPLLAPVYADSSVFYGQPDKKYFLDDYTRFITMEEVVREYVAEVRLRKSKDHYRFAVQNLPYHNYFDSEPLLLLDGVPVFDADKIVSFDPLKVKKIEVVARNYFLDSTINSGIISYTTYQGNLAGFQLDPNALIMDYPGMQTEREFYSPQYDGQDQVASRTPDFRNLLYWSPDCLTGEKGEKQITCYSSDLPGKYMVVVQGMTADGLAGMASLQFEVRK
ncbi:MAG: hypothetical protein ACHQET_08265 [Chitinophagales bacterium]